jgi:transposase-like protein
MERAQRQYSPELKQRIVEELEAGHLSLREAARDTQATVAMIQKWVAEFGRYRPKRDVVEVVMKSEQERIAALEKALAEAHLKLQVYDELLTQADKKFQLDLKKTLGTRLSGPAATGPLPSPFGPSVPSSGSRGTRTTNGNGARPGTPPPRRKRSS